jgi:hypothetical protein
VDDEAKDALKVAAWVAKQILELRATELELWRQARDRQVSYTAISRGLTLEMAALGMTPDQIDLTGTGPDNIRKRLAHA